MDDLKIGQQIKRIRRMNRLTLEWVGEQTGFTKAYISMIESGKKLPSLSTLSKIAQALEVDVGAFFIQKKMEDEIRLVRREDGKKVIREGSAFGYEYEAIASLKRNRKMEPFIMTHPANSNGKVFDHEGEEFLYVLQGRINIFYGGKKYCLRKGDSICFNSSVPHRGETVGKRPAKALVVISQ